MTYKYAADLWDRLIDIIGEEAMLDNLFKALSTDTIIDVCEYIARMYGIDL